jgi:outer membrane lipoprotein-sorting protein
MTTSWPSRRLRWAVPGLVAAGVAAAAIVSTTAAGASQPNLPPKTAAALLAAVEQAHPQALSGTIVETAKLGLPDLPAGDLGGSGLSLQDLLTGSHTMRIWYAGPTQQRIALLAPLAERDVVHNGRQLWTYTSTTNEVTHSVLPAHASAAHHQLPPGMSLTPQQLAERALRAVNPSTQVSVDRTAEVAGRAAYQLDLVPRDPRSLIGIVRIAIDSQTSLPLQLQIFARGSASPALQVGFTDISFSRPSASVFHFVKPAGATTAPLSSVIGFTGPSSSTDSPSYGEPQLLGSGWTSVLKIPSAGGQASGVPMLNEVATPVPGGHLITTALLSVLIADDGTVYAGPVSGSALEHVAATGHGL